ncbi:MAG: hypothetical protein FWF79_05635 [Defluviitaleaceae bacterium]|nr:hypothetical protein [Defluviitaleaceae bacterium]
MKKLFVLLMLVAVLVFAAACGGNDDDETEELTTPATEEESPGEPDEPEEEVAPAASPYIFSMAEDEYIQGLAPGSTTDLSGVPGIELTEDVAIRVESRDGSNILVITNRNHQDQGIILLHDVFDFQGNDIVTVSGRLGADNRHEAWHAVMLNGHIGGWNELAVQDSYNLYEDDEFSLRVMLDGFDINAFISQGEPPGIRLQSNVAIGSDDSMEIYIYELSILRR